MDVGEDCPVCGKDTGHWPGWNSPPTITCPHCNIVLEIEMDELYGTDEDGNTDSFCAFWYVKANE